MEYARSEDEVLIDTLEQALNKHYPRTPFTCSVGVSADGNRYAAVGIKLHGKSPNRKGKWTRCAIAASCLTAEGVEALVPKLRALYRDFATGRHPKVNQFYRRRSTRTMRGK